MPTYEYVCRACEHQFEMFQSMSATVKRKCPQCGKNTLERLIGTGSAIIFKGSGFYETDYRSDSYKKAAKADSSSSSSSSDSRKSNGAAKSDTAKPDAGKSSMTSSATESSKTTSTNS